MYDKQIGKSEFFWLIVKAILSNLIFFLLKMVLSLRYSITVVGKEKLKKENLPKSGGILFLSNHPAEIDPCILMRALWKPFRPKPIAIDYLFQKPIVGLILELLEALPVPNFENSSNSFKKKRMQDTYDQLFDQIRQKTNFLLYPAGGLKVSGKEVIGGNSGVHHILQQCPEANVVLVRITGLWGSSFSKAVTGKTPALFKTFLNGFKVVLKNVIFFTPRRKVLVECLLAPTDFPFSKTRKELNVYLEQWYNPHGPEPLNLVSYSFWKEDYLTISTKELSEKSAVGQIPPEIENRVKQELQSINNSLKNIHLQHELAKDLGMDSLDVAQVVVFLKDNYGISSIQSSELTTVFDVMAFAAKIKKPSKEDEDEPKVNTSKWNKEENRINPFKPIGNTLIECFLNTCARMKNHLACADTLSNEVTYKRLKMIVILLALKIKEIPGKRLGIMLPASIGGNAVILASLLAGKVPVMINWTLGSRNLKSVVKQSEIKVTLSALNFIDRLENVDLSGVDDQLILLEDIKKQFSLLDKIKAFILHLRSTASILRYFENEAQENDTAVILFTSGTESAPKGVPLRHSNILANLKDAFEYVNFTSNDVLIGTLPPFHSFGFSVTGLFPLIAGLKVAYSPSPLDGKKLVKAIERWEVTLICLAPTFFKNILKVGQKEQLKSLKYVVLGAERTPPDMYEKLAALNPVAKIVEGYGITECSPILTLSPLYKPPKGVGKALPNVELRIIHPETQESLESGKEGLILARGPNIFSGYLDHHLTSPFIHLDEKEWYNTGDLGYLDDEGYLTLSGRLKRFIKIGAEMISLGAIEDVLLEWGRQLGWPLDPDVPTLAVVSIEEGRKKGEVYLFTTFELSLEEANRRLKESGMSNLVRFSSVIILPFIPLLGSGKVDYRTLTSKI